MGQLVGVTDKRRIKYNLKRLSQVKTWQLFVVLILIGLMAATFLRLNNNGMIERRTAVLQSDKVGDATAVKNNLYSLQRYAAEHMNANTGPVYLDQSYKRDSERLLKESVTQGNNALQQADATCRERHTGYSQAYVLCVQTEQSKFPAAEVNPFVAPNPELYRHEFKSPAWSADFAGFSVLLFLLTALAIILRIIGYIILRLLLKKHYSSI